jgi:serine/threonine protein kinase
VSLGRQVDAGFFAFVFSTSRPDVLVKISKIGSVGLCNEKAALTVLDGLDGSIPKVFNSATEAISRDCFNQVVVMEKKGTVNWSDANHQDERLYFRRLARLMEILMNLHAAGFVHQDLSSENVRVDTDGSANVYLVDFGQTCSTALSEHCLPKRDMVYLVRMLKYKPLGGEWLRSLSLEILYCDPKKGPNYQYWINFFAGLGNTQSYY